MTKYLTIREASLLLRVSYRTVQRYITDGRIAYTKPAGRVLISERELMDFINKK